MSDKPTGRELAMFVKRLGPLKDDVNRDLVNCLDMAEMYLDQVAKELLGREALETIQAERSWTPTVHAAIRAAATKRLQKHAAAMRSERPDVQRINWAGEVGWFVPDSLREAVTIDPTDS